MKHVTVQQVCDLVIDRLVTGVYPLWSKLPTVRELAQEVGAHRNTVAKAYQSLASLGLITLKQGRGTYVTDVLGEPNRSSLVAQWRESASALVGKARRLGIPREEVEEVFAREIDAKYAPNPRRAAFVECNTDDTEAGVRETELLTGLRVDPLLIDTIRDDVDCYVKQYDVFLTSLSHVKELTALLAPHLSHTRIVSVYTHPAEDALAQVAQLKSGARVLVVVTNAYGGGRFEAQLKTVDASITITKMLVCPSDDEIIRHATECDAVVCSLSRARQVKALPLPVPVIVLTFHISQQSATKIAEALLDQPTVPVPA